MVFIDLFDEQGNKTGFAHLNTGKRKMNLCAFCWKLDQYRVLAGKLCDFPLGNNKTCDAPICEKHSTSGAKNVDYCPDHKEAAVPPLFQTPAAGPDKVPQPVKIKCYSLWEPWASAMARINPATGLPFKTIETRSQFIHYRGPLAIHAARKVFNPADYPKKFVDFLRPLGLTEGLNYGCVVCIVNVDFCQNTFKFTNISDIERQLGGYLPEWRCIACKGYRTARPTEPSAACPKCGRNRWLRHERYGIQTSNMRPLPRPVVLKGMQSMFDWEVPPEYQHLVKSASAPAGGLFT